ncbi:MAG: competence/damage-inducible protein A [Candidatus Nitrospinota bacterium M3_3B_026]
MKTVIITVGDEVVSGHTVNTNAAWLAARLDPYGLSPERVLTLRDDAGELAREIRAAFKKYGLVFVTGGLGPTHDDVTKPALLKAFNTRLVRDEKVLRAVRRYFSAKLKKPMPPVNEGQADVPESAVAVPNRWGTAPLIYFESGGRMLFALPGVPYEMKNLVEKEVLPRVRKKFKAPAVARRILRTAGIGESDLYEMIEKAGGPGDGVELAYLPRMGMVDLRLTVRGETRRAAQAALRRAEARLLKTVAPFCYGRDADTLEGVVGGILARKRLTLACAESCTGGLFASMITRLPGSSRYFLEGAVTYTNESKIKRLGVRRQVIEKHGAVSAETARRMAEGIAKTSGAYIGLSATGVAGPTGGTREKPVGLVYIGMCFKGRTEVRKLRLGDERTRNQERTALEMLTWLWRSVRDF